MRDVILLHPTDSVCVAARDLSAGTSVDLLDGRLQLLDDVMQGHKIARTAIQSGEAILKWGQTIGFATCPNRTWPVGPYAQHDDRCAATGV